MAHSLVSHAEQLQRLWIFTNNCMKMHIQFFKNSQHSALPPVNRVSKQCQWVVVESPGPARWPDYHPSALGGDNLQPRGWIQLTFQGHGACVELVGLCRTGGAVVCCPKCGKFSWRQSLPSQALYCCFWELRSKHCHSPCPCCVFLHNLWPRTDHCLNTPLRTPCRKGRKQTRSSKLLVEKQYVNPVD